MDHSSSALHEKIALAYIVKNEQIFTRPYTPGNIAVHFTVSTQTLTDVGIGEMCYLGFLPSQNIM